MRYGTGSSRLRHDDRGDPSSNTNSQESLRALASRYEINRCLQRHGISRLPDVEDGKGVRRKFKSYPIGYFHIDIAEVRTKQGKLYLFVAIDRTSKFAFAELHDKAPTRIAREFLIRLIAAVPYKIHTVLTDNGIHFTTPGAGGSAVPLIRQAIANREIFRAHAFGYACAVNDYRSSSHQAKAPLDHRPSRAHEPHHQGRHRQALLL